MPPRKRSGRGRAKDLRSRPRRRKVSPLTATGATYVDYKDVELLRSFVSERAKIRAQRVSGNNRQQQREVARAIKTAREMALLEYARRPMTQRRGDKRRGQRPGDGQRPGADRSSEAPGDGQEDSGSAASTAADRSEETAERAPAAAAGDQS